MSPWRTPLSPYQGKEYSDEDIREVLESAQGTISLFLVVASALPSSWLKYSWIHMGGYMRFAGWLEHRKYDSMQEVVEATADALAQGKVVAWYQGRAEAGPRALGNRFLLADPRNESMVR